MLRRGLGCDLQAGGFVRFNSGIECDGSGRNKKYQENSNTARQDTKKNNNLPTPFFHIPTPTHLTVTLRHKIHITNECTKTPHDSNHLFPLTPPYPYLPPPSTLYTKEFYSHHTGSREIPHPPSSNFMTSLTIG
jgi:hypothetical protein